MEGMSFFYLLLSKICLNLGRFRIVGVCFLKTYVCLDQNSFLAEPLGGTNRSARVLELFKYKCE